MADNSPYHLWKQAEAEVKQAYPDIDGQAESEFCRQRYRELMIQHGHLIPRTERAKLEALLLEAILPTTEAPNRGLAKVGTTRQIERVTAVISDPENAAIIASLNPKLRLGE